MYIYIWLYIYTHTHTYIYAITNICHIYIHILSSININLLKCFEALYFFDKIGVQGRLAVSIKQHLRLFASPPAPQISMLMASASTEPK